MADEKVIPATIPDNARLSVANNPVSPTGAPVIPQWLTIGATVLVGLAGFVLTLPAMGIALPTVVLSIAGSIVALGTALGIASPGVRTHQK